MPSPVDYTDLNTVKSALGIDPADTAHDALIAKAITAVSRKIDEYTGRRFWTETETRYYHADVDQKHINPFSERRFGSILKLDLDDIVTVTQIQIDMNGDRQYEVTLSAATDYYLGPQNAPLMSPPRPYTDLTVDLVNGQGWYFPPWPMSVAVTGLFGFSSTVPDEVGYAALLQAIRLFKRPSAPFGVLAGGDFAYPVKMPVGLDPDVQLLLCDLRSRFKKVMFA